MHFLLFFSFLPSNSQFIPVQDLYSQLKLLQQDGDAELASSGFVPVEMLPPHLKHHVYR